MKGNGAQRRTKTYLIDTNVVLHDSACLQFFRPHDVAIPLVVLEELDRFKRGSGDIHYHAREFLRTIDELPGDALSETGLPLGEDAGHLRIVCSEGMHKEVRRKFRQDTADHDILSAALALRDRNPERPVILVSKDTNLRVKARSFGILAEDFTGDAQDETGPYTGTRLVENISGELIHEFFEGDGDVPVSHFENITDPHANENFIIKNCSQSVLATYREPEQSLRLLSRQNVYGITPRNAEQCFAVQALTDDSIQLVTLAGKAGTGKTLLALAAALECRARYRQILLARPLIPLSNRDIGYLPGDADSKIDPYMQPLFDNLSVISHQLGDRHEQASRIQRLRESGKLQITPLAFLRGRTLPRVFFIVDEAQNLTPHEVKTIVTRAGEGSKVVFTGDTRQIDQPYLDARSNGFSSLIRRMTGQPLYAHIALEKGERSALSNLASELL